MDLHAAPATLDLIAAIDVIRALNTPGARKIEDDAPVAFIRPHWKALVFTDGGLDRGFYAFCALTDAGARDRLDRDWTRTGTVKP